MYNNDFTNEYEQIPEDVDELENAGRDIIENTDYKRISYITAILMVGTALFFDVIQMVLTFISALAVATVVIPFILGALSIIISFISWGIFYFWLKINHVNYFDRKIALKVFLMLIGFIPLLNALPDLTLLAIITIYITRTEDKLAKHAKAINRIKTMRA